MFLSGRLTGFAIQPGSFTLASKYANICESNESFIANQFLAAEKRLCTDGPGTVIVRGFLATP